LFIDKFVGRADSDISMRKRAAWYSPQSGIDYEALFEGPTCNQDSVMNPARSIALRTKLLSVCGVAGLEEGDITFSRKGNSLIPDIPCIKIDCESSILTAKIGPV